MSAPIETPKAELKSADTPKSDETRSTVTGGLQKPSTGVPENTTTPGAPATAAGLGSEQTSQKKTDNPKVEGNKEEQPKEGSEAMVRGSYLPANKLKDAPPLEKYEGQDPMNFAKDTGVGTGSQIKEKVTEIKDKIVHIGKKDKS